MINAHWTISSNVGDLITPFLIEKITGERAIWAAPQPEKQLLGCGSILNHAQAKNVVWGAGLASFSDQVCPEADIRAVRGPLSRAVAIACGCNVPNVCGDPALLLPRFVDRAEAVAGRVGVVPHYVDAQRAQWWYGGDGRLTIVDVLQPVETFVADLTRCEFVFSSSLHGLIIAAAYGIPNVWVRMSEDVGGDGMKFMDHMAAVGRPVAGPLDVQADSPDAADHALPVDEVLGKIERYRDEMQTHAVDVAPLWDACPFRDGGLI